MDGANVKEVRGVDRGEDGHGRFVAYVARLGGGSGLTHRLDEGLESRNMRRTRL